MINENKNKACSFSHSRYNTPGVLQLRPIILQELSGAQEISKNLPGGQVRHDSTPVRSIHHHSAPAKLDAKNGTRYDTSSYRAATTFMSGEQGGHALLRLTSTVATFSTNPGVTIATNEVSYTLV